MSKRRRRTWRSSCGKAAWIGRRLPVPQSRDRSWGMFGDDLKKTRLVSISPVTTATLRELGLEPAAEAAEATVAGVVDVLCHR